MKKSRPHMVNYSKGRLRVMCPNCGIGGANTPTYQPKCHQCSSDVLMQPASNNQIECTWEEFISYLKNKKEK